MMKRQMKIEVIQKSKTLKYYNFKRERFRTV